MKNYSIRQARQEDREAIEDCVQAAYAKYIPRIGMKPAPLLADYHALIANQVAYVLVCEEGIRGVLVMIPQGQAMHVENIAVHPNSQGQGLGHALMAFVEQHTRKELLQEIRLYTHERMTENLHFYHNLGFQEEDRRIEDEYHRVFLHKILL
jgi:ribosomal protein S18 acetylase RimI-like enzyme